MAQSWQRSPGLKRLAQTASAAFFASGTYLTSAASLSCGPLFAMLTAPPERREVG